MIDHTPFHAHRCNPIALHTVLATGQYATGDEQSIGRCRCPFHDDSSPSAEVKIAADGVVRFACHAKHHGCPNGDVFDLQAHLTNRTRDDVIKAFLCDPPTSVMSAPGPSPSPKKEPKKYPTREAAVAVIASSPDLNDFTLAKEYFYSRSGEEGPCAAVLRFEAPGRDKEIRNCRRTDEGLWEAKMLEAPRPLYRQQEAHAAARIGEPVVLCEGEKTSEAIASAGYAAATSMGGANAATKTDHTVLAGATVVYFPDADKPKKQGKPTGAEIHQADTLTMLKSLVPRPMVHIVAVKDLIDDPQTPSGYDAADMSPEEIRRRIDLALASEPYAWPTNDGTTSKTEHAWKIDAQPSKHGKHTVCLRVDGKQVTLDAFKLSDAKKRDAYVAAAIEEEPSLAPEEKAIRAHLFTLAEAEMNKPAAPQLDAPPETAQELLDKMPPEVVAEAEAMLANPKLLDLVSKDIEAVGVAGEHLLCLAIYLLGTSRLFKKPMHIITKGPSASGKSYTVEQSVTLFPAEAVIMATQVTPKAILYAAPGSLRHKLLVMGERSRVMDEETGEEGRVMRELKASGKTSVFVPVKDPHTGKMTSELLVVEGPVASFESTTGRLFDEDKNRCLILSTDDSPEQTSRVLKAAGLAASGKDSIDTAPIIARHHALQRILAANVTEVVISFAERLMLAFDQNPLVGGKVEARRAGPLLLTAINTVAALHFRQREKDEHGRIIATLDDYAAARRIFSEALEVSLGMILSKPARRFITGLKKMIEDKTIECPFTVKGLPNSLGSESSRWNHIHELKAAGFVETKTEAAGRAPESLDLTAKAWEPEPEALLPTPEALVAEPCPPPLPSMPAESPPLPSTPKDPPAELSTGKWDEL